MGWRRSAISGGRCETPIRGRGGAELVVMVKWGQTPFTRFSAYFMRRGVGGRALERPDHSADPARSYHSAVIGGATSPFGREHGDLAERYRRARQSPARNAAGLAARFRATLAGWSGSLAEDALALLELLGVDLATREAFLENVMRRSRWRGCLGCLARKPPATRPRCCDSDTRWIAGKCAMSML